MANKPEQNCLQCGILFPVTRAGKIFCSQRCANKNNRQKKYVPKPRIFKKELNLRDENYNWAPEVDPWFNGTMNDGMNQMWG